jgi:hypothetical protein
LRRAFELDNKSTSISQENERLKQTVQDVMR